MVLRPQHRMPSYSSFGNMWIFLLVLLLGTTTKEPSVTAAESSPLPPEIMLVQTENTDPEGRAPPACTCLDGLCSCCTGFVLGQLGVNLRQRGCMNVTYDPDDFAFTVVLGINNRVLYKNTLSGKNPEPVCVSVPGVSNMKFCAIFSNVYFAGRNIHMCISMEGRWAGTSLFKVSFDCMRIGANGVAMVKPEDGGGLPLSSFITGGEEEDYDDDDDEF